MAILIVSENRDNIREELHRQVLKIIGQDLEMLADHNGLMYKHPDIHIIQYGEKDSIKVEDIHDFQTKLLYKPLQGDNQIGIICNAQNMTAEAQNALLKTLEDAPNHTQYILTVNHAENLLQTIRSRCRIIYTRADVQQDNSSTQYNGWVEEFIHEDFFGKIKFVETIGKQEDKDSVLKFLKALIQWYNQSTEFNDLTMKLRFIQKIQTTYVLISRSNINRKNALTNLVVQLYL